MKKINTKMMLRKIFLIALVVLANTAFAQKVQRSSISSWANSYQSSSYYLHTTMGQNSVVGTIANDSTVLRQGFEQPQYLGCMDPLACNYDPAASIENGTCRYDVAVSNTHYICQGESLAIGNSVYTSSGTYTDVLIAANKCDSIITTVLHVSDLSIAMAQTPYSCS